MIRVVHRVVRGTTAAITEIVTKTATGKVINPADIERLNATFRAALAPLARRGRTLAHFGTTLTAGMYRAGCADRFAGTRAPLGESIPPTDPAADKRVPRP